jgi:hypothetical protein
VPEHHGAILVGVLVERDAGRHPRRSSASGCGRQHAGRIGALLRRVESQPKIALPSRRPHLLNLRAVPCLPIAATAHRFARFRHFGGPRVRSPDGVADHRHGVRQIVSSGHVNLLVG